MIPLWGGQNGQLIIRLTCKLEKKIKNPVTERKKFVWKQRWKNLIFQISDKSELSGTIQPFLHEKLKTTADKLKAISQPHLPLALECSVSKPIKYGTLFKKTCWVYKNSKIINVTSGIKIKFYKGLFDWKRQNQAMILYSPLEGTSWAACL